jgi:hypothetical protein
MAQRLTGPEEGTTEDRQTARAVNFSFLHGMGVEGLRLHPRKESGPNLMPEPGASDREGWFGA